MKKNQPFFVVAIIFSLLQMPLAFGQEGERKTIAGDSAAAPEKKTFADHPAIQFVKDLMEDNFPVMIDFGAEPGEHGSTKFARVQYNWNNKISSNIYGGYSSFSYATYAGDDSSMVQQTTRAINAVINPFVYYVGNAGPGTKTPFLRLDSGMFYTYSQSSAKMGTFDINGVYLGEENKERYFTATDDNSYHSFGPVFGFGFYLPFAKILSVGFESSFSPFFFLIYEENVKTHVPFSDSIPDTDTTIFYSNWSTPRIETTLFLDTLKYFRIKTKFSYTQLSIEQFTTTSGDSSVVTEEEHIQKEIVWRFGGELVKPARSRKKNSHLTFGVYYEHVWNKQMFVDDMAHTERWVFCFGT